MGIYKKKSSKNYFRFQNTGLEEWLRQARPPA
jgi:hypothetical protein